VGDPREALRCRGNVIWGDRKLLALDGHVAYSLGGHLENLRARQPHTRSFRGDLRRGTA
jgi:hypothetical protein